MTEQVAPGRGGAIAYVVNGFPRRSETFIASEIYRLEQAGFRLRTYAVRPGDTGDPHPVVGRIRASPDYLQTWVPTPGTPVPQWIAQNLPSLAPALHRTLRQRPAGVLAAAELTVNQALRARRVPEPVAGLTYLKEFLLAVALADRILAAGDVTHLHAAFAHRPATVALLASTITGLPFSFTGHAKDIYVERLNPAGLLARKLRAATFVLTCTEANRRHLLSVAPGARVQTIYHGLNADFAALLAGSARQPDGIRQCTVFRVLGVGRLVAKKGFDLAVEACAQLLAQGIDVELRIIGGRAEQGDALAHLIAERGLEGRAHLLGARTQAEVLAELRRADAFCLPCRVLSNGDRDGIPNVLVEAMAAGVPVVTTSVSGIPELVEDGVSGLVVPPDDTVAVAGALALLAGDPALATRIGQTGRQVVSQRFDGDRLSEDLVAVFDRAVCGLRGPLTR